MYSGFYGIHRETARRGVLMKKGKITIDRENCKGCYLCVRACPLHLIAPDTRANAAGIYPALYSGALEACIACGSCYTVCRETINELY